ncbi:hypothetical protein [Massilia sp. TSP1-1-2]|uniref:hypothetical protein n=1 Tax=unclassified Massilia TaxID=2609279 RepID=UPI003CEA6C2C
MHIMFTFISRACAACLLAVTAAAQAAPAGWIAVDSATLERSRGGFITAGGLTVSLGIERLVSINGSVVSRTSFHIADIGRLDAEQARQTGATLSAIKLIQNGGDNMMLAGLSNDTLSGMVIQNTLNDQRIDSKTIINASVNSIGLLKTINFNGNVSEAIAQAVVPR